MSEWKEYKLGDVCTELSDGLHKAPIFKEDGDYIFVNAKNIAKGYIVDNDPTKKSTHEEYLKYSSPLNDTTILYSIDGTIGNIALYRGEKCILGKGACYINPNPQILDRMFLYYTLQSPHFNAYIDQMSTGSTIQHISLKTMRNYVFTCPPLDEQKRIASILSSLDDKIDLLNRENATLEAMAETLFRQWFIEEAKEDWEEMPLSDCIMLIGGGTPKTSEASYWNGNICWLSGGDIANNHKRFVLTTEKSISEEGINHSSAKLLPENATVVSARGTVGKYCLLSKPMAFSQSNYGIIPKYDNCFFFTYLLITYYIDELQSAAYGSVFDTITTKTFDGVNAALPQDKDFIIEFEKMVEPYFSKMKNNALQIQSLARTRDLLLSKLMSNEIKL